ncbi:hypothetical protein ACHAXR_013078 [Thalassiosira sp. AJA248-18]
MATALVRRKGVLALALSSSLAKTHAFSLRQISTPSRIILHNKAASTVSDDPSLKNETDYEWLKQSRPMRIHARLLSRPNGEGNTNDIGSSSSVTKIVHFQRHGQGTHNEIYKQWTEKTGVPLDLSETDPEKNPFLLPDVIDAPLTQKGRDQCAEQRFVASKLEGVELVVSSPLVRALQTAHITFEDHLPFNTPRHKPETPWIVHESIREELGTLLCNKRRPLSETEIEFPEVDYTYLPYGDEDVVWNKHVEKTASDDGIPQRETIEDMSHRAYNFLANFIYVRPEREIVVVGHSAWLLAMTGAVLDVTEEDALITPMFGQAELRSMELTFLEQ